jgi:pyruvate/2-oxoglutarate dehydrogenase complex dihydrolipoamide acyltransferase (E2) component
VAKKMDKAVKDLAKELKKLRKENEKLAKTLEKTRKDQAESSRKILALLEERLPAQDAGTDEAEDHSDHDENGGFVTAETAAESADGDVPEASADAQQDHQEEPEVTDAAKRRAKELNVDPTGVEGTGSGGRVLVKDVEAAAGQ